MNIHKYGNAKNEFTILFYPYSIALGGTMLMEVKQT